jgi:peptide/nickel transport system substrate-binding protein
MTKRWCAILAALIGLAALLFAGGVNEGAAAASETPAAAIKNPGTVIKATTNTVETLDPQFMLSSATMEISFNVYDSLLGHPAGDMETLTPSLSTTVPTKDNGLISIAADGTTRITFPIRKNVKFQNGQVMTPADVVYTFKRGMLVGAQATAIKMLCANLLGENSFADLVKKVGYDAAYSKLDEMVSASGDNVTFKLPKPFVPFLGIMADGGSEAGILNKDWCVAQGDWPGTKETGEKFMTRKMEDDPLFGKMMGTGPFKLVTWDPSERLVLEGFKDYWRGAPKLERVIRKFVPDDQAALLLLKAGDADIIAVTVSDLGQVKGVPGIKVMENLPSAWLMKINMVQTIAAGSSYIGDGSLGPNGIPASFFSDINVRKAFEYSFNWDTFIKEVFLGAAIKPYGPVLVGFPTANPKNPQYSYDPEKAKEYFKKAWGGQLWDKGFKLTAVYSAGSKHRQMALEILKANIEALNPKFKIELASLPWAGYVGAVKDKQLPLTLFGMLPDVFDPYLPLFEHMDSAGGYADWGGYVDLAKKEFDPLVDIIATNYDPQARKDASYKLQKLDYDYALAILHFQAVEHVALRDWIKGFTPGAQPTNIDFYPISKE